MKRQITAGIAATALLFAGCAQDPTQPAVDGAGGDDGQSASAVAPSVDPTPVEPSHTVPEEAISLADQVSQAMNSLQYFKFTIDNQTEMYGETNSTSGTVMVDNTGDEPKNHSRTESPGEPLTESIVVDGRAFTKIGDQDWVEDESYAERPPQPGQGDLGMIVRQASEITEAGAEDLAGVSTTKYSLTLVDGTAEIWLDDQHRIVRSIRHSDGEAGSVTTELNYYDFDVPNQIVAPI